jgi:hypothetical protein
MASKRSAGTVVPTDFPPGLVITDRGLEGRVIEVTADHPAAAQRHAQVAAFVDAHPDAPPGGLLILLLVINDQILDSKRLHAATSKGSRAYHDGEARFVEFDCEGGWRDRREISTQTAAVIELNKGSSVSTEDWRWASKTLRSIHPLRSPFLTWQGFLSDAQSWWYPHCPGPMFDHAIAMAPFQLLPSAALARHASGLPQCVTSSDKTENSDDGLALAQTTFGQTADTSIVDQLKIYVGQVARSKGAKDSGREKILLRIQQQMPVAAQAGRTQIIVLGAIRHAILAGGVRGEPWAPITIYEYLRQGISQLLMTLLKEELDSLNGEKFYEIYVALLQEIKLSQRAKFEAFLLAFHRYLLICGYDHLPRALSGKKELVPPAAAVVWKHELDLALTYVDAVGPTPRVVLQAKLGLVLGFWIPLRTVELWCIRMCDVHINNPMFIAVYTRQRDGVGKVKSLRRQEDDLDMQLKKLLLEMVELRQNEDDADDEDYLLGQPHQPGMRHEQVSTAKLMNDALKWATGDATASYYDLRHTAFSTRGRKVLEEAAHGN